MEAEKVTDPIRVLVVDDSALARQLLSRMLNSDPEIRVVGTAADAFAARDKIKRLAPQVLTLDIEMPRMNGLQFLRNLMRLHPMPVVMVSSLTQKGAELTLSALELGAVDFVAKPRNDVAHTLLDYTEELLAKVKMAARARVRPLGAELKRPAQPAPSPVVPVSAPIDMGRFRGSHRLIAVGASTGGTEAIRALLTRLPASTPGMVICQHIPKIFSGPFAQRMNSCSPMSVSEARDGDAILDGHAYIAPGDRHLVVVADGSRYRCRLLDDPPYQHHRPSVDLLFRSVAQVARADAMGVLLTGMGADGASGMRDLHAAGALTMAQDQATSVVWGMPGAAVALGCVDRVLPITEIADAITEALTEAEARWSRKA